MPVETTTKFKRRVAVNAGECVKLGLLINNTITTDHIEHKFL